MYWRKKTVDEYWLKQSATPLFPDLVWARPETKSTAGKLLITGGHAQSFAAPAEAYANAQTAGIGAVRVLLPDSLEKTVSKLFPAAEFCPSNPSGGFATRTLAELLAAAQWADGVLLAGDVGRNSETTAMFENFSTHYAGQLTITKDVADFFCAHPASLGERPDSLLVITTAQLQRLGTGLHTTQAFTSDMGIMQAVRWLHDCTEQHAGLFIITKHLNQYLVAVQGRVSTTPAPADTPIWRVRVAAAAATWWLQNPSKPFEALTSSVL